MRTVGKRGMSTRACSKRAASSRAVLLASGAAAVFLAIGPIGATPSGAVDPGPVGAGTPHATTRTTPPVTVQTTTRTGTTPPVSAPTTTTTTTTTTTPPARSSGGSKDKVVPARSATPADASASATTTLVGTFKIQAGSCSAGQEEGSYFRMLEPGQGPGASSSGYLTNGDSSCSNQTYTLFKPGTSGGLVTGGYQPVPSPAFDASGDALAAQIIQPATFFGVKFSVSTEATDPQTNQAVPAPAVEVDSSGSLTGNLEAWSAAWNKQYFNQGAPKPGGGTPGFTSGLTGTYTSATGAYTLNWTSQIVGGPFNSFTGQWHLVGTFAPASGSSTPTTSATASGSGSSGSSGTPGGSSSGVPDGVVSETVSGGSAGSSSTDPTASGAGPEGTLPLTGLAIPLWFPFVVIAAGCVLMAPFRRLRRAKREEGQ